MAEVDSERLLCPACRTPCAYVGVLFVSCVNSDCQHYDVSWSREIGVVFEDVKKAPAFDGKAWHRYIQGMTGGRVAFDPDEEDTLP